MFRFILVFVSCVLIGCQQNISYDYLMLHPDVLDKMNQQCQLHKEPHCEVVKEAARDFAYSSYEQSINPELFGKRVIETQQNLVKLRHEYEEAKLHETEEAVSEAKQACQDESKKLLMFYAVIAARSPGGS